MRLFLVIGGAVWLGAAAFAEPGSKLHDYMGPAARKRLASEFERLCPKAAAATSGHYCVAFSRPNDDPSENHGTAAPYETARFAISLKVDPENLGALTLDFRALVPPAGEPIIGGFGIRDFKNDLQVAKGTDLFGKTDEDASGGNMVGKVSKASLSLGSLPKKDGRYQGEVLVGAADSLSTASGVLKHKLLWSVTVKEGKVHDVELRFDPKAKEIAAMYFGKEIHDLLPVASNIAGQPTVLPYAKRPPIEVWRPALVTEVEPEDLPKDLPPGF